MYEINPCDRCPLKAGYGGEYRCSHCELTRLREENSRLKKRLEKFITEPVRHAHWEKIVGMAPPEYHGKHVCSLCKTRALDRNHREELSDFCPHCGAKMDVEED